jgi:hypothetical protein
MRPTRIDLPETVIILTAVIGVTVACVYLIRVFTQ